MGFILMRRSGSKAPLTLRMGDDLGGPDHVSHLKAEFSLVGSRSDRQECPS
jgi:hypothetical protein